MQVTFITTVNHNIGDDFVREGILYLLQRVGIMTSDAKIELVHKHSPITNFNGFAGVRNLRVSRLFEPLLRNIRLGNRINDCDLLIQSGAPVYWCHPGGPHCANNEWYDPLVKNSFVPKRRNRFFFNIAGGSCQRYRSDGAELRECQNCQAYIREFYDACDLTVLRDDLARTMLNTVSRDAPVLPCTSIFARDRLGVEPRTGDYIVLNFMDYGGHFTFGQSIDKVRWRNAFKKIAAATVKMGKTVVACHNQAELELASEVLPGHEIFMVSNDHVEYMRFYAGARFGIVNRVHAAFMMASLGKPAVVIGNDSRARMVESLKLPSFFVDDVQDVDMILAGLTRRESSYRDQIEEIRLSSRDQYCKLIVGALERRSGS